LSNLHTGAIPSLDSHPFGMFFRRGFRVCLNTDDRLMSDTSMTQETTLATQLFNLSLVELEKLALNAMKSAFAPFDKRLQLIFKTIKPGYAAAASVVGGMLASR
jgi:adenosine deaminase